MEVSRSLESLNFSDSIREGRARVAAAPGGVHRVHSYVERGFYAPQIERLLAHFGREQLHFLRTDRLWVDPEETLDAVQRFLGLPPRPLTRGNEYIVPVQSDDSPGLDRADNDFLLNIFAEDIRRASALTQIHLTDWMNSAYSEPMVQKSC
jgi:hypothetical protein